MIKKKQLFTASALILLIVVGAWQLWAPQESKPQPRSWQEIIQSGTLRVVTEYNSIDFHLSGDTLVGFQYELVKAFADAHHLELEIAPQMTINGQMEGITSGKYDLIASNLLVTSESKDSLLLFSTPILVNKQVLVQRRKQADDDSTHYHISSLFELGGKTLYVTEGSPAIYRINNLSEEIADTIHVKEMPRYGTEQLLILVAHGDIDYAVCEANTAKALQDEYPQLDISKEVSFNQFYSWAVYRSATETMSHINSWMKSYQQTDAFKDLLKKYNLL